MAVFVSGCFISSIKSTAQLHSIAGNANSALIMLLCSTLKLNCGSSGNANPNSNPNHTLNSSSTELFQLVTHLQGCSLGLDVSVSRRSRDVPYVSSRLVSEEFSNVSVSSRSRG